MTAQLKSIFCLFALLCLGKSSLAFLPTFFRQDLIQKYSTNSRLETVGEPLMLTPYLHSNQIRTARNLSEVPSFTKTPNVKSFSGFFTVNKNYDSNMFFWFFPSMHDPNNAPLILWLCGGPGVSLMDTLFNSVGPYFVDQEENIRFRPHSWTKNFSVLHIDNPVQTGYSFTGHQDGLARNQTDVGRDLFEALKQFFSMFPEYKKNDLYVGGISYGGKYGPTIAHVIHTKGKVHGIKLKGLIMESGFNDPENMINYSDFLYHTGLISRKTAAEFKVQEDLAIRYIHQGKYWDSFHVFNRLLLSVGLTEPTYFAKATGMPNYYNFHDPDSQLDSYLYVPVILSPEFRKAIHVGNLPYNGGQEVMVTLMSDLMQSVKSWTETIMNNYKVLMYSGQADVIVNYILTQGYLEKANWKGANEFKSADRIIWKVDPKESEIAGYVRQVGNLTEVMVRNAGHLVGYDKPREVFDLLYRFAFNKKF